MPTEKYVCAFRGRRDSYQVPLALAESDLLDQFITDAYATAWVKRAARLAPARLRDKAALRSEPGIPDARVRSLWCTTMLEHARHRAGIAPMVTYNKMDRRFSLAAAARARRTRSHLFLYSPYAWEAFTASYSHTPRKVLFQFHPHPALERRILEADSAAHPAVGESFGGTPFGQAPDALAQRDHDAWRHADLIFCASAFTRRSLAEAGADEAKCRVVPYGIHTPPVEARARDDFHVAFVGSGGQRKGLHHLLLAWRHACLPAASKLTLVCRVMDEEISRMAAATPRVEIVRGLPQRELDALYERSALFAMPSLVEGFGQVYLEALAQGCPVLGTANTCLPDLGGEDDGIFLVEPGDVEGLAGQLERLARVTRGNHALRLAARACAAKFTWPMFRAHIAAGLASP